MKTPKALQEALDQVEKLPDHWFGSESASFDDLPCIASKSDTIRTSIYLKSEDLVFLKQVSKVKHVPVAQITGEIISQFIEKAKAGLSKAKGKVR